MILHPESLWLLTLLVPVMAVFLRNFRRGRYELFKIGGEWRRHQLYDVYFVKGFFSSLVFMLFVFFTVLSLAGFSGGKKRIVEVPPKADIVFAVDISRSMLCDDLPPSRLSRSLEMVKGIIGRVHGERYGLVVFKGRGVIITPVTEDYDALMLGLLSVSPSMFTSRGTNIGAGLLSAASAFPGGEERKRIIILFSDGDNLSGDLEGALKKIKNSGIDIMVFGAGTVEGRELKTASGAVVKDKDGNTVTARLNRPVLKFIASSSGGRYYEVGSPDSLNRAADDITSSLSSSKVETVKGDSYTFYLVMALLSIFIFLLIRIFPWKGVF